ARVDHGHGVVAGLQRRDALALVGELERTGRPDRPGEGPDGRGLRAAARSRPGRTAAAGTPTARAAPAGRAGSRSRRDRRERRAGDRGLVAVDCGVGRARREAPAEHVEGAVAVVQRRLEVDARAGELEVVLQQRPQRPWMAAPLIWFATSCGPIVTPLFCA